MTDSVLPDPDSPELQALGLGASQRAIYRVLYKRRDDPPTMLEIRDSLQEQLGSQEQLDRRRRDLNQFFLIEKVGRGRDTAYKLIGPRAENQSRRLGISEKARAQVLQYGRCAMCGRTPLEHGVILQVDHKMPQEWGGTDDIENLQPLCEECNRGKKNFFQTLDQYGEQIRAASEHLEPHRRIAELLLAFYPNEVRSDIIEMVAHQHQYQEDWQKRMRELRKLGWDYDYRRETDPDGRVRTYYRLTQHGPLPEGNLREAINRQEQAERSARGSG